MILTYHFSENIPVFKCTLCGKCSKIMESTCYISKINRGCCWYFPKYTLIDLKNILNKRQDKFISYLVSLPNSIIENYTIIIKGLFLKKKYREFMLRHNSNTDFDSSLFFKLCPFFKKNGCSLNFFLRPHPCNLYLCRKVVQCSGKDYISYSNERKDYYAYCNYFNECMEEALRENNTNLNTNLGKSLKILKLFSLNSFSPRKLAPICFTGHM